MFPVAPDKDFRENCNDAGVIGTLPGTLGTLQANEVIKIITGIGEVLNGRVLIFNILTCQSSVLRVKQRAKKRVVNGFERENIRSTNNVISYQDVIEWCRLGNRFQLIDVRSESERQLLSLGGGHIPLNQLAYKLEEIDQSLPLVIYCQSGARSNRAVMYLTDEGFENVMNLSGGVMRLSEDEILLLSNLYNNIR